MLQSDEHLHYDLNDVHLPASVDQGGVKRREGFRRMFSKVTVESRETESEITLTVSSVFSKLRALVD